MKGLELCRLYYEEVGAPALKAAFPELMGRAAAGLAGQGSDCLGFDDEYSRDHDFGPGFLVWLTDADFEALQEFPNLTKLEITYPEGLGLSDLTPLSGLTNLTYLRVRTQGLTSLDGIETLTRLETLNIDGQDATFPSLEPLGHLTELKNLRLPIYDENLEIYADLTPLANCTKLESLRIDHKVADLSPLSGLKQLVSLNISDGYMGLSGYQTLEPLSGLENLAALSLRNYNIRDLSGLEGAHALQNLYIETQNQLTDISALRDLEHLTNVTLIFDGDENLISDMSPLDHVPNVTVE